MEIDKMFRAMRCFPLALFLLAALLPACSDGGQELKGRWEMFVGEDPTPMGKEYGVDNLSYVIELNTAERTFNPEGELPGGRKSYGFMDFSNMSRIYRYDIDSVGYLGGGRYVVKAVDPNWMTESMDTLAYDAETGKLAYVQEFGDDWVFSPVGAQAAQGAEKASAPHKLGVWGVVIGIIALVVVYYLFKIAVGYVMMTLGAAFVGGALGGLVLWGLMGGLGIDLPRWAIWSIVGVPAGITGLIGLWEAIKSTGQLARMPFATRIAKEAAKAGRDADYVVDEYGNKLKVTSTERGILGEKYLKTEGGRNFRQEAGSDKARETD